MTRKKQQVTAYCRVSSDSEEQMGSLNAQTSYYEKYIKDSPDYIFAGCSCQRQFGLAQSSLCD